MAGIEAKKEEIIQYCGFKIGDGHYAVPVLDVQEIIKSQKVTAIPLAQEYVRGLINLRGQIVTAISLRKLFGLEENLEDDHMNIIVRSKDGLTSLVVDEIMDVINVKTSEMEKTPETVSPQLKKYIRSVYKPESNLIILLDLDQILNF